MDQVDEPFAIFFFGDLLAKNLHALSFIRGHPNLTGRLAEICCFRRAYEHKPRRLEKVVPSVAAVRNTTIGRVMAMAGHALRFAIASLGRGEGPPFLGRLAAKELTGSEASEAFNFLVDRSQ
jgi:hypothetical protein